jgi:para-nitrobenzyl esterase
MARPKPEPGSGRGLSWAYLCLLTCLTVPFMVPLAVGTTGDPAAKGFGTLVQTEQGKVEGFLIHDFHTVAWLGIPYAQPPVGTQRWKAPQDTAVRDHLLSTKSYGHPCSQQDPKSSEDCLYLNIWRPDSDETKLPVFVYIHGGSNLDGSGEGSWHSVARHYNVVTITLNYRLGPMGWFLHPALMTGNPEGDSGNFGTLDQIKALEWVQKNIETFGGDKSNVTLAGASAGAQNVTYLMHSALAKDLFQKVIIESDFPGIRPVSAAFKSSKQVLYNLLVADGTAPNTRAAKLHVESMTKEEIRDYLYCKSPNDIAKTYFNTNMGPINWGDLFRDDIRRGNDRTAPPLVQSSENRPEFVFAIGDGRVLPKVSFADFSEGRVFPRPTIIGTTKNENNMWNASWPLNFQEGKSLAALVTEAVHGTNPAYRHMQKFYDVLGEHNAETLKRNYKFATELIDEVDTYLGAQMPARHMAATKKKVPVYVYRFDWGSDPNKTYKIPCEDAWVFYKGAIHVQESDFFYQTFFGLPGDTTESEYQYTAENLEGRKALSLAIRPYLYDFLHDHEGRISRKAGQPVEWKPWTEHDEQFIVFDADYAKADVQMSTTGIARTPEQLYAAQAANRNEAVRDLIEYYVLWSWQWNWYPNSTVGHFDTSPGPNSLFDPAKP